MVASVVTPVTVLTGFLGSGKTTLANRLLAHPGYSDTAFIVNELGEAAIDHALVRLASGNVVVLAGGCVCCRVAGDLVQSLRELHFQRAEGRIPAFRRAIVETTGLADPAPLLTTLIEMPLVAARYSLAGVVTTVDGEHGMRTLDEHPEAVGQAAIADRLVLTKVDRVREEALAALTARLAALNPGAPILRAARGEADPAALLDTGLSRAGNAAPEARGWLDAGAWRHARAATPGPRRHDARIRSFVWSAHAPLEREALENAMATLLELFGDRILRVKGLVDIAGEGGPTAIHAVGHTLYPPARLPDWPDADRSTRIVFIARDLEESLVARTLDSLAGAADPGLRAPAPPPVSRPR